MLDSSVRFIGLLCGGLAAGIALCIFFVERAWTSANSGQFYTELMQLLNRALTVPAPALGALSIAAIVIDSVLLYRRSDGAGTTLWLGVAAVVLGIAAGALTKFGHFPINDQVLKWSPSSPPPDWMTVQAKWSTLHVARTISAVGSFALFLLGTILRQ